MSSLSNHFSKNTISTLTSFFIALSLSLCFSVHAQQPIYKRVLPNGQVIYSNQGGQGAQPIELAPMPTPRPQANPEPTLAIPDNTLQDVFIQYEIKFVRPQNQQTYTAGQPNVDISLEVNPALAALDKIQLFIDDMPYGNLQSDLTYSLSHLNRGAHTLQAKIYGDKKSAQSKAETGSIVIYIQKPSIQNPPH